MAVLLAAMLLVGQAVTDVEEAEAPSVEPEATAPMLSPREYLYANYPGKARRLDCMIRGESTWRPGAVGYRGWYVGLAQFDLPTWYETPQGKAGLSRYDPYASIDAMVWGVEHLGYGRWPVTSKRC